MSTVNKCRTYSILVNLIEANIEVHTAQSCTQGLQRLTDATSLYQLIAAGFPLGQQVFTTLVCTILI